jgi:KipI family sensor histidine kinase inhibitor
MAMTASEHLPTGRFEQPLNRPGIYFAGDNALLFKPCDGAFDAQTQARLLAIGRQLEDPSAPRRCLEAVPGVNNLLVVFDSLAVPAASMGELLWSLWAELHTTAVPGREVEIPVVYGGEAGEDLPILASKAGLTIHEYVERHSEAVYSVACIGAYPGFVFMSGLPDELKAPRRATPRLKLQKGSVIVGGAQAGVMPCTAPSGWHTLGSTSIDMFDVERENPCLLLPGDIVRFRVEGVKA